MSNDEGEGCECSDSSEGCEDREGGIEGECMESKNNMRFKREDMRINMGESGEESVKSMGINVKEVNKWQVMAGTGYRSSSDDNRRESIEEEDETEKGWWAVWGEEGESSRDEENRGGVDKDDREEG